MNIVRIVLEHIIFGRKK